MTVIRVTTMNETDNPENNQQEDAIEDLIGEDLDIELAGTVTTRSSMGRVGGSRPMFFSHYCGMRIGRFWPHARSDPISREAVSSVWMSRAGVRSTFTILVSKGRQVIPNVGRFLNGSCEVVRCKLVRS